MDSEISILQLLINNISSFSLENINSGLAQKCFKRAEELLKLLKPKIESFVYWDLASSNEEVLGKAFAELDRSISEVKELFGKWQPSSSKLFLVLQTESLLSRIRNLGLDIAELLKSDNEHLPEQSSSSSSSTEYCIQKLENLGLEETSLNVEAAIKDRVEGIGTDADILAEIAVSLSLRTNLEILIELVALENLKEAADQAERSEEVELFDQLIGLVTRMHDQLIIRVQKFKTSGLAPIPPPDFCCPLSLELMKDPVIVASGQTYERSFIKSWIELGLTVCPKTRHVLGHTFMITNYTVKALIANWCDLNNVKLPDSNEPVQQLSPSIVHVKSCASLVSVGLQLDGRSRLQALSVPASSLSDKVCHWQDLDAAHISMTEQHDGDQAEDDHHLNSLFRSLTFPRYCPKPRPASQTKFMPATPRAVVINCHYYSDTTPSISDDFSSISSSSLSAGSFSFSISSSPSTLESQVKKLVKDLNSTSIDTQREATDQLRLLGKHNMENRIVIARSESTITSVVNLLRSTDMKIQENATVLLHLSINENKKTAIVDAEMIDSLIYVLETGSPEGKENSAATLFSLAVKEENKVRIGTSGAIGPLVDLLGNGTLRGKKNAATALFNLSMYHENKVRMVTAGVVKHLVDLMVPAAGMMDKAVAVLANLATIPEGRNAITQQGTIPVLFEAVKLGSARGKENAAAALLQLCTNSASVCNMVLQQGAVRPLVALSQSGTPRAKEKVQLLLWYFRYHQRHAGQN